MPFAGKGKRHAIPLLPCNSQSPYLRNPEPGTGGYTRWRLAPMENNVEQGIAAVIFQGLNHNIKSKIQSNREIKNMFYWGLSSAPKPLQPLHDWLTGQTLLLNTR
jgi:hypothetical protein